MIFWGLSHAILEFFMGSTGFKEERRLLGAWEGVSYSMVHESVWKCCTTEGMKPLIGEKNNGNMWEECEACELNYRASYTCASPQASMGFAWRWEEDLARNVTNNSQYWLNRTIPGDIYYWGVIVTNGPSFLWAMLRECLCLCQI